MAVENDLLLFRIGASHFLWKIVRRIVGALVELGRGNLGIDDFRGLLEDPNRKRREDGFDLAAHTAPPSGLFLESVLYNKLEVAPVLCPAVPVRKR